MAGPGGVQGDDLLDGDRLAGAHVDGRGRWAIEAVLLHGPPLDGDRLAVPDHPGAGRLGDPHARSSVVFTCQPDDVVAGLAGLDRYQVAAVERPVALHAGVGHRAVRAERTSRDPDQFSGTTVVSRPARCGSAMETKRRWVTLVARPSGSRTRSRRVEHAAAQVELLPVAEHLQLVQVQPPAALGPEGQRQPVGQVDQVLVLDLPAGDLG